MDAASQLGLNGPNRPVRFDTFQEDDLTVNTQVVDLVAASMDGTNF